MIRERIVARMHDIKQTQTSVSKGTGIEYTAINTFLNNRKGMWFGRVQQMLDFIGLTAEGEIAAESHQGIQRAAWVEIRCRKLGVASVAKETGVSYGTLNGFINNKGGMSIEKVERLMEVLNIELKPSRS